MCEISCLKHLLTVFVFKLKGSLPMHYDNQFAIYIAKNLLFYDCIKHIEVDYHIVRDAV